MGEYITTGNGDQVKLGTCEHLMYARKDEVEREAEINVEAKPYLDPECNWIYRFPWPQEDGQGMAQVNERKPFDYEHFVFTCDDLEIDHQDCVPHFSVAGAYGVNVWIPCPASKDFPFKTSQGGPSHPFWIIGERVKPDTWYKQVAARVRARV